MRKGPRRRRLNSRAILTRMIPPPMTRKSAVLKGSPSSKLLLHWRRVRGSCLRSVSDKLVKLCLPAYALQKITSFRPEHRVARVAIQGAKQKVGRLLVTSQAQQQIRNTVQDGSVRILGIHRIRKKCEGRVILAERKHDVSQLLKSGGFGRIFFKKLNERIRAFRETLFISESFRLRKEAVINLGHTPPE